MRAISIIFRRELATYLRSPMGYVVAALMLFIDGVLFQTQALSAQNALSADVLRAFFMFTGIVVMIAGVALSVRLITEERTHHTIILLNTSPIRDVDIILGKYLAALVFLTGMILLSLYMPLLIMVNGKIAVMQLVVGYLGLILLGASTLAIGIFCSALNRRLLLSLLIAVVDITAAVLLYPLAQSQDGLLRDVFGSLDMWQIHFFESFRVGIFNVSDLVYYLAVIYFFLLLATKTLEAKRWQ